MSAANTLEDHVRDLAMCERCPKMHRPSIVTVPVQSKVLLVGQAPGAREPVLGRPFATSIGLSTSSNFLMLNISESILFL